MEEVPVKSKRGRKKGSGFGRLPEASAGRRRHIGPEAEATIRQDITENNLGLTECCKKYNIGVSAYYRLKGELKNGVITEE